MFADQRRDGRVLMCCRSMSYKPEETVNVSNIIDMVYKSAELGEEVFESS